MDECYFSSMNAVRGRVRGGRVEIDAVLPEGTEVVVLIGGDEVAFDLDDAQLAELENRTTEADPKPSLPADDVLTRLRQKR